MKRLILIFIFLCTITSWSSAYAVDDSAVVYEKPLAITPTASAIVVSGKFDTAKSGTVTKFDIKLYYDKTPLITDVLSLPTTKQESATVQADGSYSWTIPVTTNTTYYLKQVVTPPNNKPVIEYLTYDPKRLAAIAAGSAGAAASTKTDTGTPKDEPLSFEQRSYRLLAPWPGLSVLLDPDLCQEQQLEGKNGQICSINDFLNYMFKLLIGLAAVMLVLRLIYEGYQYIVTDIPFLKASAKSGVMEAFGGLFLALSAFLILNTLNPKLVENKVKLDKVTVGIEEIGSDKPIKFGTIGGGKGGTGYDFKKIVFPSGISCPGQKGAKGDIKSIALSFKDKVTYNQDLRGTPAPNNTVYLDCSSYVNTVLNCAGVVPPTEAYTGSMASTGNTISSVEVKNNKGYVNGIELKAGDLVGSRHGDSGHVWIYIGDGQVIDSQVNQDKATKNPKIGGSVIHTKTLAPTIYGQKLNFVKRI